MTRAENVHDRRVREILLHPHIILDKSGIPDIGEIVASGSAYLLNGKKQIGQVDGWYLDEHLGLYLLEYKCGDKDRTKAKQQLVRAQQHLWCQNRPYSAVLLYVHGRDYDVEVIKD